MVDIIRSAMIEDFEKITLFLRDANLSIDGIEEIIEYFVLCEDEERNVTSVLGIEPVRSIGLLRSLAVRPSVKEAELITLFQHVYNLAKSKKLSTLVLITNKEACIPLLQCMGFHQILNENVPNELKYSTHSKQLSSFKEVFYMERAI
jgi:N-acetylglutamate synthase-like GNAT family acetyltransferase